MGSIRVKHNSHIHTSSLHTEPEHVAVFVWSGFGEMKSNGGTAKADISWQEALAGSKPSAGL